MVEITIEGDNIVFTVEGWDKLWSLRSRLQIPLSHISGAHQDPDPPMGWFDGIKMGGAAIPNVFRAGTFYQQGEWVFWDVHEKENAIVIELEHENYKKLIVEVADPAGEVKKLRQAVGVSA
jgi:hypothetical protein